MMNVSQICQDVYPPNLESIITVGPSLICPVVPRVYMYVYMCVHVRACARTRAQDTLCL